MSRLTKKVIKTQYEILMRSIAILEDDKELLQTCELDYIPVYGGWKITKEHSDIFGTQRLSHTEMYKALMFASNILFVLQARKQEKKLATKQVSMLE